MNFASPAAFHFYPDDAEPGLQMTGQDDSVVERIYPDKIPGFAEQAMERLYGSLYACLPQLRLSTLDGVHTYAAWHDGSLRALFLYRLRGPVLRVVNEGMAIEPATASRFAQRMFEQYPEVRRVHFRAVQLPPQPWPTLAARFTLTEDMVISLPPTQEAYVAALGKATRKSLRLGMARARGLSHRLVAGSAIEPALVEAIVGFNRARMQKKQRESALNGAAVTGLMALMHARGLAGFVMLDGRLCAGTLACRLGDDVYSLVNAHDPAFDALGMGRISRHLLILAAIRHGVRRFHLLGGHLAGKQAALAQRVPLEDLLLYRSRLAFLRDTPALSDLALAAMTHVLRSALEDQQLARKASPSTRLFLAVLRRLQRGLRTGRQWLRLPARVPAQPD